VLLHRSSNCRANAGGLFKLLMMHYNFARFLIALDVSNLTAAVRLCVI
jgi:hypothetical protein